MSSDQVAKLAASIDVLTNAVQFLVAERVSMQPPAVQGALLHVLQRALSVPTWQDQSRLSAVAIPHADLARWAPIVATNLIDDVRRQLGRAPEGVTHIAPAQTRMVSETVSEMAERARCEYLRGAVAPPKGGRSLA